MALSISVIQSPNELEPAYTNYLPLIVNCASSSISNFNYLLEIYTYINAQSSTTASYINQFQTPPAPSTGYGEFSLHRILNAYLSYDFNYSTTDIVPLGTNSTVYYSYSLGFNYAPGFTYSDVLNIGGFMAITASTILDVQANDILTLQPWNSTINPQYNATASITSVPNSYTYVTNIPFASTYSSAQPGYINLLQRYTTQANISSIKYAFNGSRQYIDGPSGTGTDFTNLISTPSNTAQFLTTYGQKYFINENLYAFENLFPTTNVWHPINPSSYHTLQFYFNPTDYNTQPYIQLTYLDINQNTISIATHSLAYFSSASASTYSNRWEVGAGIRNLTWASFPTNCYYYIFSVILTDILFPYTETALNYYYKVIQTPYVFDLYTLYWKNRYGAFDQLPFNLDNHKSTSVTRTEWKKYLPYNYTIGQRQYSTLSSQVSYEFEATSDFFTEYEANWFEQAIYSNEVFIIGPGSSAAAAPQLLPIIITDTSYRTQTAMSNKVIQFTIKYKVAYDIFSQYQ